LALAWESRKLGLRLTGVCADFVSFASAVFEIDTDIASASVGLVQVGATTGSYIAIEKTRPRPPSQIDKGDLRRTARASRVFFST